MNELTVWVDGDSCPRPVRAVIFRAAKKRGFSVYYVANRAIDLPGHVMLLVAKETETETADDLILERAREGDLVITRDIPLAERALERNLDCINDRGTRFTPDTIAQRRSERDRMEELRQATGIGMAKRSFGKEQTKDFADTFDRYLTGRLISRPVRNNL